MVRNFKHIVVDKLPVGWKAKHFAELTKFRMGKTPPRNNDEFWNNGKYPWVSIADMEPFGTLTKTKENVSEKAHEKIFRRTLVPAGSLLMSFKLTIGRVAKLGIPAYHNEAIISFRADSESVDSDFLFYYLAQINYKDYQDTAVKGQTLNKGKIEQLEIALPPLPEQRKIAAVLGVVQRAIEQQERLLALIAELKKTLLHQLFTQGLRGEPQKQTEIGLAPESWELTPLGNCCNILSGSLSYTDMLKLASSDEVGAIECMGVKVSDMNLSGNESKFVTANLVKRLPSALAQRKLVPANTVVFPKRGAAIATNKKRMTTTWTVLDPNLIGVCPKNGVDAEFLFHWLQIFDLRKITDPGPTPQLNKKDLVPVLLPLPSTIEEQKEIAHIISTVDSKIRLHERKRAALTDLFRTLLHQLMTAQIRVYDLDLPELEHAQIA